MSNRLKPGEVEAIVLAVVRQGIDRHVGAYTLDNLTVSAETVISDIARGMVIKLRTQMLAKEVKVEPTEYARHPRTWWDAFKDQVSWFPKWWLRRWPAQYSRYPIQHSHYYCCPHLNCDPRSTHFHWLANAAPAGGEEGHE